MQLRIVFSLKIKFFGIFYLFFGEGDNELFVCICLCNFVCMGVGVCVCGCVFYNCIDPYISTTYTNTIYIICMYIYTGSKETVKRKQNKFF